MSTFLYPFEKMYDLPPSHGIASLQPTLVTPPVDLHAEQTDRYLIQSDICTAPRSILEYPSSRVPCGQL